MIYLLKMQKMENNINELISKSDMGQEEKKFWLEALPNMNENQIEILLNLLENLLINK